MARIHSVIRDDVMRKELMFRWLNVLLAFVAFVMTVVNVFTREYILMLSTLIFSVACIGNFIMIKWGKRAKSASYFIFVAETVALLTFFLISGIPNGFSALWVCLIPSFSLLIFGRKAGTYYSALAFSILIFFFWVPWGKSLLQYHYTKEFMLRFPLFFTACYILALSVEVIRAQTQKQLVESERKYYYLYRHDALTGLYNRYGFNAAVDAQREKPKQGKVAVMILDVDDFKFINDRYGHGNGDIVLQGVADIMRKSCCQQTFCCRWGGEEFTAYMYCDHDYEQTAQRLRLGVEQAQFRSGDLVMRATVSVGLCIAAAAEQVDIATLVNQADQCLYAAKDQGKNRVVCVEIS